MRSIMLSAMACASLLCATSGSAEAQVFFRPWFRPRVIVVPPRIVPIVAPPVMVAPPPPPVYVQPYPQPYVQPYPQPYYYAPPPPPVYAPPPVQYTQPLPPPPVYVQPPPPVVVQQPPPPVFMAPPAPAVAPLPPPVPVMYRAPEVPQWKHRFGLGFRFAGAVNFDKYTDFSQLGFGGEFLYRAHRRIVLELAGEYQKRVDNGFARWDVPVTLGMRVHIGAPDWALSPYFVFAAGAAYADLDFLHSHDRAWFADGQAGGGLELRLGKRFAISADLRGDARYRLSKPDEATAATLSIDGKPFAPMGNQYGAQFRLGAALYF